MPLKKKVSVTKDAKGDIHVFLPQATMRNMPGLKGIMRTLARGDRHIQVSAPAKKPRDMRRADFEKMKALLNEFLTEEQNEPEHQSDKKSTDHWYVVKRSGGYELLEGAGQDGGEWAVRYRGRIVRYKNRPDAEEHMALESNEHDGKACTKDTNCDCGCKH